MIQMVSSAIIVVSCLLSHVVVLVDGQPKACTGTLLPLVAAPCERRRSWWMGGSRAREARKRDEGLVVPWVFSTRTGNRPVAPATAFWSRARLLHSLSLLYPILESSSQPPKCDPIRASSGWMGNVTTTSPPFALPVRFVLVVEIYSELSRGEMDETGGWIAMGGIRMEKAL
jgi:hypothetical protein